MDQLFDECSIPNAFADKRAAHAGMLRIFGAARELESLGYAPAIRTTRDFKLRELAPGFSVLQWFMDRELAEHEERRLFLARCSKAPYLEELHDKESIPDDVEYSRQGQKAYGLTLGLLWGCPVLSLTEERDGACHAALRKTTLLESGNFREETLYVLVVRDALDVQNHQKAILNVLYAPIRTGQDILASSAFPHLKFCENAQRQLAELRGSEQFFPEILRHLRILEKSILADIFRPQGIDYAPRESEMTMHNAKCRQGHSFLCPDGSTRLFWEHSKIYSANKRIYFISDCSSHTVLIGHIGEHLPVSSQ